MDSQLDRLEAKVDKTIEAVVDISLNVAKMEVHLERNTDSLSEHMRRTDASELRIERLEKIEHWMRGAVWIILGIGSISLAILKLRIYNAN